jgi:hypothetical protein
MIQRQTAKARAVEWALGTTGTGKEQIAIRFQILEGEDMGQYITYYGYFTEATLERTLESLDHCGWEGDNLTDLTGLDKNDVHIVIDHEPDEEGKLRARVRWINSAGGIALKDRMDPGQAAAFAARMRGEVIARRARKGTAKPAAAPAQRTAPNSGGQRPRSAGYQQPPPHSDDDIPF